MRRLPNHGSGSGLAGWRAAGPEVRSVACGGSRRLRLPLRRQAVGAARPATRCLIRPAGHRRAHAHVTVSRAVSTPSAASIMESASSSGCPPSDPASECSGAGRQRARPVTEPVGPAALTPAPAAGPTFHHHRGRLRSEVPAHMWITWLTSACDGYEHAVDDEIAVAGSRHSGTYPTVCGHLALPRSLTSPPGPRCPRCVEAIRAQCPETDRRGFLRTSLATAARALRSRLRQVLAGKE